MINLQTIINNSKLFDQLQKYVTYEELHNCSCIYLVIHKKYIIVKQLVIENNIYSLWTYYHPLIDIYLSERKPTNIILSDDDFINCCNKYYNTKCIDLCVIYEDCYVKKKIINPIRDMLDNKYIPLPFDKESQIIIQNLKCNDHMIPVYYDEKIKLMIKNTKYTDHIPFPTNINRLFMKCINDNLCVISGNTLLSQVNA